MAKNPALNLRESQSSLLLGFCFNLATVIMLVVMNHIGYICELEIFLFSFFFFYFAIRHHEGLKIGIFQAQFIVLLVVLLYLGCTIGQVTHQS